MRTSRRFHLNLPSDLESPLAGFARAHGLGLGPAIRTLLGKALQADLQQPPSSRDETDSPAALAALTAAELVVLMVASVLPEGQRRRQELEPEAALAAEGRLALFKESGQ